MFYWSRSEKRFVEALEKLVKDGIKIEVTVKLEKESLKGTVSKAINEALGPTDCSF